MAGGRTLLTLPREVAEAERLQAGTPLDQARLARLARGADDEAAYRTALRALERRPFGARDLQRRLVLKGHSPEAAGAAVTRATAAGLVDDTRFALHFIQTRAARGRGPLRLRRDLGALGVDRAVVERALTEAFGPAEETAPRAEELARRRLAQLRGLPPAAVRRRLLAYLARRGFAGDPVRRLVDQLVGKGGR